ncbi:hypothetical protein Glove_459g8 [Diversispora epigaea]|uniref:Uncharacterized protein n=1 Tax=Diversispora epigaea TaxID=1348612 RepID=A0A397GT90_9GLOM|nr:hypothetical protein Glove_459g8 [Diversispora epigaea]
MSNVSEKDGFDYFTQTLVHDWDPLGYHIFWQIKQRYQEFLMIKSNGTRGTSSPARYSCYRPFMPIDSQKGGRVYLFREEEMHTKKLNKIEKDTSIRICNFQAQHHLSVANRMLTGGNNTLESNPLNIRNDNVANTSPEKKKNKKSVCNNNLKRKRDNDKPDYEGLSLLFDELNEDALVESIDEKVFEQKNVLLQLSSNSVSMDQLKNMDAGIIEAFHKYQKAIPKTRKIFTSAYWGVLDLTRESLYDCKKLTEENIMQLSQDFANKISWKTIPLEENIQEYFDSNCKKKTYGIKKLDVNIQFMIKNAWGEIQVLPINYARNEKGNPFKKAQIGRRVDMKSTLVKTSNKFEVIYGKVAEGLGPLGIPTACRKKHYFDKITSIR